MFTLDNPVSSVDVDHVEIRQRVSRQDYIATESQIAESPIWDQCATALLGAFRASEENPTESYVPSRAAVIKAFEWVKFLRNKYPDDPLTGIIPNADGGLIIERRATVGSGQEYIFELTIDSDGTTELTQYLDGKVRHIATVSVPA